MRRLFPWIFALACAAASLFFWPAGALYEDASDLLPAGPGRDGLNLLADAGMLDRVMITVSAKDHAALAAAIELNECLRKSRRVESDRFMESSSRSPMPGYYPNPDYSS